MVPIIGSMAIKGVFKAGSLISGLASTSGKLNEVQQRSKSTTTEMKRMTHGANLLKGALAAIGVAGFSALLLTTPQLAGALAKIGVEMKLIAWSIGKHLKPVLDAVALILKAIRTGNWEMFKAGVREAWNGMKDIVSKAYNWIKNDIYPGLKIFWTDEIKPAMVQAFETTWNTIKGYLPQWVIDIGNWAYNMGVAIKNKDWGGVWSAIIAPFEWAWNTFKDTKLGGMITGLLNKIKEYSEPIREAIETLIEWKEVGKEIWKGIWEGIKEGIFGMGNEPSKALLETFTSGTSTKPIGISGYSERELENLKKEMLTDGTGQTGLHVPKTGLYKLHAGETVTMKGSSGMGGGSGAIDIVVDFSGAIIHLASGIELDQFAEAISMKIAEKQQSISY